MDTPKNQGIITIKTSEPAKSLLLSGSRRFPKSEIECYEYHKYGKRISQFDTKEDAKFQIGETLKILVELVGITELNRPSTAAKKEIAEHVYVHYKTLCPEEIKLAFSLYFEGKFLLEGKDKKLDHYQSFSIPYLSKILGGYIKYKSDAVKKVDQYMEQKKSIKQFSERLQKSDQTLKQIITNAYKELNSKIPYTYTFSFATAYDFLKEIGMIDISDLERNQILAKVKQDMEREIESEAKKQDSMIKYKESLKKLELLRSNDLVKIEIQRAKSETFKRQLDVYFERKLTTLAFDSIIEKHCYICSTALANMLEINKNITSQKK